jgi:hypothetical protein
MTIEKRKKKSNSENNDDYIPKEFKEAKKKFKKMSHKINSSRIRRRIWEILKKLCFFFLPSSFVVLLCQVSALLSSYIDIQINILYNLNLNFPAR